MGGQRKHGQDGGPKKPWIGSRPRAHGELPRGATVAPTFDETVSLSAQMPKLAGCALEAPSLHNTGWTLHQRFTAKDDPDRMRMPWTPPKFLRFRDPAAQHTVVSELMLPHRQRHCAAQYKQSFARVLQNVLDEEDCAALIASVNKKGFTPALLNMGGGCQQLVPGARDGHRVIVDSPQLTEWLFQVLRPYLPDELEDGSRLVELNERCRFLCYTPGQQFPPHCDGCFERAEGHPQAGDFSFVTVQLYLNDVPRSHGGATTFLAAGRPNHQPEAGSVLLFSQDLMHEGSLVERGIKYTLRTEAMYSKRRAPSKHIAIAGNQMGAQEVGQADKMAAVDVETSVPPS